MKKKKILVGYTIPDFQLHYYKGCSEEKWCEHTRPLCVEKKSRVFNTKVRITIEEVR